MSTLYHIYFVIYKVIGIVSSCWIRFLVKYLFFFFTFRGKSTRSRMVNDWTDKKIREKYWKKYRFVFFGRRFRYRGQRSSHERVACVAPFLKPATFVSSTRAMLRQEITLLVDNRGTLLSTGFYISTKYIYIYVCRTRGRGQRLRCTDVGQCAVTITVPARIRPFCFRLEKNSIIRR